MSYIGNIHGIIFPEREIGDNSSNAYILLLESEFNALAEKQNTKHYIILKNTSEKKNVSAVYQGKEKIWPRLWTPDQTSGLILWIDGTDTEKVKITYSNTASAGIIATGKKKSNTLAFTKVPDASWEVGQRIRLGGAGTGLTADTLGADTYTITAISSTTVTVEESLTQDYSAASVYRAVVSHWQDKSSSGNDANITPGSNTNFYNWKKKKITLSTTESAAGKLGMNASLFPQGKAARHFFTFTENNAAANAGYQWVFAYGEVSTSGAFCIGKKAASSSIMAAGFANDLIMPDSWEKGVPIIIGAGYDGTKIFARKNGGTQSTHTGSLKTGKSLARLGLQVNDKEAWNGSIYEHIGYNRVLSDTERQKIEGYLAHKWGLISSLPASHPYKTTPPYQ